MLSYLGNSYLGWQKTKMGDSIEESLEIALQTILQEPITLQAASRTDAGVHAQGQVVNLHTTHQIPLTRLHKSLNQLLPKEISVLSISEMPPSFHPTIDSTGKEYLYHLCNTAVQLPFLQKTSWHFPYPLDLDLMITAASQLLGTHDFSAFCNERSLWDRNPICHVSTIEITQLPNAQIQFRIVGDHFLYKMVRNLVGTLVYVGCGKLPLSEVKKILLSRDRTLAGMTAPAHGLCLTQVFYKNPLPDTMEDLYIS